MRKKKWKLQGEKDEVDLQRFGTDGKRDWEKGETWKFRERVSEGGLQEVIMVRQKEVWDLRNVKESEERQ